MIVKQTTIKSEYYSINKYYGTDYTANMFRDLQTYTQLRKNIPFIDILNELKALE
jgi:hypothetical protein